VPQSPAKLAGSAIEVTSAIAEACETFTAASSLLLSSPAACPQPPAIREAHQAVGAKTLRQIAAALNGRGIGTARGGKWAPQAVANVVRRVG
jgi:hypothetical protein